MNLLIKWFGGNKLIAYLLMVLVIIGVIYLIFGERVISSMYESKSVPFLNDLLKGRSENPLEFYIKKYRIVYVIFSILISSLVLSSSFFIKLIENRKDNLYIFKKDCENIKYIFYKNKRYFYNSILVWISFYCLYIIIGIGLLDNIEKFELFGSDYDEFFDWNNLQSYHKGSHPLLLILLQPFKFVLGFFPFEKPILAVLLNSFFGASAVSLSYLFFWQQSKKYVETLILTIYFGLTMSQLAFSSIPESYSMAACSIIPTYILFFRCLQKQRIYLFLWILIGLLSFGVTITNFAQTLICFTIAVICIKSKNRIVTILEYGSVVICLSIFINIIQKSVLGGVYVFVPNMVTTEIDYIRTTIFNQPLLVVAELFKHFFLVNFVSASPFPPADNSAVFFPITSKTSPLIFWSFFGRSLSYSFVGLLGTFIWIYVSINGLYKNISLQNTGNNKNSRIFLFGVSLAILGNMALHSIYGAEEMFLYTCNFTFPVFILLINYQILQKPMFKLAWVVLILLAGVNNLSIMSSLTK